MQRYWKEGGTQGVDLAYNTLKQISADLLPGPHEGVPRAMDHRSSGCLSSKKFPTIAPGRQGRGPVTFLAVCGSVRGSDVCLMKHQKRSPQITHVSWGRLEVEGKARGLTRTRSSFQAAQESGTGARQAQSTCRAFSPRTCRSCWTTVPTLWCFREGWRNACRSLVKPLTS